MHQVMGKMKSGIYRIALGNDNFYIGSAVDLANRENEHRSKLKRGIHDNKFVQNCWNKYQVFEFFVLEECFKEDLIIREQFHIDQHLSNPKMTNICLVAGSTLGLVHSPEARAKISAAMSRMSSETKAKMSRARMGHTVSVATRAKISAAQTGKVISAETKAKLSAANKGKVLTAEHRAKMSASAKLRWASVRHSAKADQNVEATR